MARLTRRDRDLAEALVHVEPGLLSEYIRAGLRVVLGLGGRQVDAGVAPVAVPAIPFGRVGGGEGAVVPLGEDDLETMVDRLVGSY